MKKAKFLVSHFDAGTEKFKAGHAYDLTDETRLCIKRGAAVEVDVPDETPTEQKAGNGESTQDNQPVATAQPATKSKK